MSGPQEPAETPLTGPSAIAPTSSWEAFVRGWRPFGGWVCCLMLLMHGVAVPAVQLARGQAVSGLDWTGIIALVGLLGLGGLRSFDRARGTA